MPDSNAELYVGGQVYGGWQSFEVKRSISGLAGAFQLDVTDNWTGRGPVIIRCGDPCVLKINGTPVITGYVDSFDNSLDGTNHSISVSGRDKTSDLVDCSAIVAQGEVLNQTIDQIARAIAAPFGIEVKTEADPGAPFVNFSLQPGESGFSALDRAAKLRGLLFTTDGSGALILTRIGIKKASGALVEGKNVKTISLKADTKDRYSQYIVKAQKTGTDDNYGASAAHVRAEASDATVTRYRPLVVIAEDQANIADAEKRAQWEAKTRAANAASIDISVQGFEQTAGGDLWGINQIVGVESPTMGIQQGFLISDVNMSLDERGSITNLKLVRSDAFIPEPVVIKQGEPF